MATKVLSIASTTDPRLSELVRHGGGEGYATYTGLFEGRPAFIADCGTLADLLDEEDSIENSVTVNVFESEVERAAYLETLRSAKPRVDD